MYCNEELAISSVDYFDVGVRENFPHRVFRPDQRKEVLNAWTEDSSVGTEEDNQIK